MRRHVGHNWPQLSLHCGVHMALTPQQGGRNPVQSRKSWASVPGPSREVGERIGFLFSHPPGPPALLAAKGVKTLHVNYSLSLGGA